MSIELAGGQEAQLRDIFEDYACNLRIGTDAGNFGRHISERQRYLLLRDVLCGGGYEPTLQQIVNDAYSQKGYLTVRDAAVGNGDALEGLLSALPASVRMKVMANGIVNPLASIGASSIDRYYQHPGVIDFSYGVRDLRFPPEGEEETDVLIVGFMHYYVLKDEMWQIFLENFSRTRILAIIPANCNGMGGEGTVNGLLIFKEGDCVRAETVSYVAKKVKVEVEEG